MSTSSGLNSDDSTRTLILNIIEHDDFLFRQLLFLITVMQLRPIHLHINRASEPVTVHEGRPFWSVSICQTAQWPINLGNDTGSVRLVKPLLKGKACTLY